MLQRLDWSLKSLHLLYLGHSLANNDAHDNVLPTTSKDGLIGFSMAKQFPCYLRVCAQKSNDAGDILVPSLTCSFNLDWVINSLSSATTPAVSFQFEWQWPRDIVVWCSRDGNMSLVDFAMQDHSFTTNFMITYQIILHMALCILLNAENLQ